MDAQMLLVLAVAWLLLAVLLTTLLCAMCKPLRRTRSTPRRPPVQVSGPSFHDADAAAPAARA